jgi:hypothetical protein
MGLVWRRVERRVERRVRMFVCTVGRRSSECASKIGLMVGRDDCAKECNGLADGLGGCKESRSIRSMCEAIAA